MKGLILFFGFIVATTSALAQGGPPTSQRTCSANRQLVLKEGAVVLDTGPGTYARFVKNGSECMLDTFPEPAWVRSSNNPQCFIGYRCRESGEDF